MTVGKVLADLPLLLERMEAEARRRKAPIYDVERSTGGNSFKLLVFTMLSARTKDERTLKAVETLFSLSSTPAGILSLGKAHIESILRPIGFFRAKAKNLMALCRMLDGHPVPGTFEGLVSLPGVGRKTANIVLAKAFGKQVIGVDVHVHRMSNRLGLARTKTPQATERALMRRIPAGFRPRINTSFVGYGQTVCAPLRPLCSECVIKELCPRIGVSYDRRTGRYHAKT